MLHMDKQQGNMTLSEIIVSLGVKLSETLKKSDEGNKNYDNITQNILNTI